MRLKFEKKYGKIIHASACNIIVHFRHININCYLLCDY